MPPLHDLWANSSIDCCSCDESRQSDNAEILEMILKNGVLDGVEHLPNLDDNVGSGERDSDRRFVCSAFEWKSEKLKEKRRGEVEKTSSKVREPSSRERNQFGFFRNTSRASNAELVTSSPVRYLKGE